MAKKMLIDATHAEETRVVVVDGNKVEEFDFESENKRQIAGNIYLAKVTRVEPSLQAAFIDYGGNRHGFLAFSEIHPDYYQIPVADRQALLAEERAFAEALAEEEEKPRKRSRSRSRGRNKAEEAKVTDAVETREVSSGDIPGMETLDLDEGADDDAAPVSLTSQDSGDDQPGSRPTDANDADHSDDAAQDAYDDHHDDDDDIKDASEKDDEIESIADEDVTEEIRRPRKPRARRYKIQEVVKVRQILLVQVVKEERGNKGAALTTYLSLAGRYCVLMPNTARGGGISRKITNAVDRKKLKDIANEIDVPDGAGLIVRTAGAKRTKSEIKRDYEYLQRLWEEIRALTLKSTAPAKIYEEGDLIKRSIRDLYNREIDEVIVEGEAGYRTAKDFMKMIMPSHAKNVKNYTDPLPLLARYQVETYLGGMFNPTVQLKSGGYIVIGITEALVAIDVNSGRATKENSIEETALKTNIEAAEEVARQLRLRDLAGLIVIDFIDMEERKNNAAVEKRFKDKLKTDRARIQVGRISGFGLLEMSRQRLRPGMLEATTQPCPACHGTGLIRSDDSLALSILRQLEEEGVRRRSREVLLKAPVAIVNFLMNNKREHVAQIEARYGLSVRIEADPFLIAPDFSIEKFKTATRVVEVSAPVVSVDASLMSDIDEAEDAEVEEEEAIEAIADREVDETTQPKKRRRRRRRRRGGSNGDGQNGDGQNGSQNGDGQSGEARTGEPQEADAQAADVSGTDVAAEDGAVNGDEAPKPKSRRRRSPRKSAEPKGDAEAAEQVAADEAPASAVAEPAEEEAPAAEKPKRKRAPRKKAVAADVDGDADAVAEAAQAEEVAEKPKRKRAPRKKAEPVAVEAADQPAAQQVPEDDAKPAPKPRRRAPKPKVEAEAAVEAKPVTSAKAEKADTAEEDASAPKKRGWWSLGR